MVSGSFSLPYPGFFSPFPHGTSSLSVSKEYLALDDGPPIFSQDFSCPDLLVRVLSSSYVLRIRGFHPLRQAFPNLSTHIQDKSHQALPRSLAATQGISFDFFSFGYWDVSVPQVRFLRLCRLKMTLTGRVPPFGHLRINACFQLPEAFRRIPRPSSPLTAKASTLCAFFSWPYNLNNLLKLYA